MSDMDNAMWRNVLLAGARGLEFTFGAVARALSGAQPAEVSGYSVGHDTEPSQSVQTGKTKRGKKTERPPATERKEKRAPSEYNIFMAERMKVLKEEQPDIPHTEHFKLVAQEWKTSGRNKKNQAGGSNPPSVVDAHEEDYEEDEAEGLLEGVTQEFEEEGEEVTGGLGITETGDSGAAKEKAEKKKKKKRKHEKETVAATENGGPSSQKGMDEEGGTPEKRTSKKGKR